MNEKEQDIIKGYVTFPCENDCKDDSVRLFIIPTNSPPSYLLAQCTTCKNTRRYQITEVRNLGEVSIFTKDMVKDKL